VARPLAKDGKRSRKTINKILTQAHTIFQHAVERFGLIVNVTANVKRLREREWQHSIRLLRT